MKPSGGGQNDLIRIPRSDREIWDLLHQTGGPTIAPRLLLSIFVDSMSGRVKTMMLEKNLSRERPMMETNPGAASGQGQSRVGGPGRKQRSVDSGAAVELASKESNCLPVGT